MAINSQTLPAVADTLNTLIAKLPEPPVTLFFLNR